MGKSLPAFCQSVQPSRQTSESLLTRPSESHLRIMSPRAGPYCPPVGGRTYQMAAGASVMGSSAVAASCACSAWAGAAAVETAGALGEAITGAATAPEPLLLAAPSWVA